MFDLEGKDTIVALATPRGRSAIAVVRLSGPQAFALRDQVFRRRRSGEARAFVVVRGDIVVDGSVVDDALCVSFPGPKSYTGDDLVELSLHGSPLIIDLVMTALLSSGARAAEPGELTLRAVLAGRLDLAEAEAVDAVVSAKTTAALQASQKALRGGLRAVIEPVRAALIDVLAELEARLDFPDDELGGADKTALASTLSTASTSLRRLLDGAQRGRRLRDGARVVLYGPPNAGKSTLLNALVGHERALVHEEPGTTRDAIEAEVDIGGVACVVVDVAGIRDGDLHPVEARGIDRARAEVARADVVVVMTPASSSEPFPPPAVAAATLAVTSKIDLGAQAHPAGLALSALTGQGIDALLAALATLLGQSSHGDDESVVQTARQEQALRSANDAIDAARAGLDDDVADEVVCSDVRQAARALDRLLGRDVSHDVLDLVFSRFCIGK